MELTGLGDSLDVMDREGAGEHASLVSCLGVWVNRGAINKGEEIRRKSNLPGKR